MRQGGTTAHLNSNKLEKFLIDILLRKGYKYTEPKIFSGFIDVSGQKSFSHQANTRQRYL